jgi:hypothetical protein
MILKHTNTTKVRLSDSAMLAGTVSLMYAFALMLFPSAFPELLTRIFDHGQFFLVITAVVVCANEALLVVITNRRYQKTNLFSCGYIAFLTIGCAFVFRALLVSANAQAQLSRVFLHGGRDGIGSEELLIYTHLALVSGIFFPYLMVRITQNYIFGSDPESQDVKVKGTAAGQ